MFPLAKIVGHIYVYINQPNVGKYTIHGSYKNKFYRHFDLQEKRVIKGRKLISIGGGFNGFNPFGKYARQIGSFPQVGVKIHNF